MRGLLDSIGLGPDAHDVEGLFADDLDHFRSAWVPTPTLGCASSRHPHQPRAMRHSNAADPGQTLGHQGTEEQDRDEHEGIDGHGLDRNRIHADDLRTIPAP